MKLLNLIFCHLIGDHVLQLDHIAKTKGSNWYNLIVHCLLYCLPFYILFGIDYRFYILLLSHVIIDTLKARFNKINYITDQVLHYLMLCIYLI